MPPLNVVVGFAVGGGGAVVLLAQFLTQAITTETPARATGTPANADEGG